MLDKKLIQMSHDIQTVETVSLAVPELEWLLNAHGEGGVRFRVISSHGFPDIRRNSVYLSDLLHSHLQASFSFHDI